MGLGCGEVAGGSMSVGMGCVRVFNTGDDGGEKLLEATVPQQVWTNHTAALGMDGGTKKERPAQMHPVLNIHLSAFSLTGLLYLNSLKLTLL